MVLSTDFVVLRAFASFWDAWLPVIIRLGAIFYLLTNDIYVANEAV